MLKKENSMMTSFNKSSKQSGNRELNPNVKNNLKKNKIRFQIKRMINLL
jgi:hypothetical protein